MSNSIVDFREPEVLAAGSEASPSRRMRRSSAAARAWMYGTAVAGFLTVAACQASGNLHGVGNVGPVSWDATVGLNQGGPSGGTGTANNESSKCYEVKYYDGDGAEVGTSTITPGANHGAIPAGAKTFTAVEKPCPPPTTTTTCGMVHHVRHGAQPQSSHPYNVVGGPLVFDARSSTGNALYEFDVSAQSTDEARDIVLHTLTSSLGDPIDPRLSIKTWLRADVAGDGGRLVAIAQAPFAQFRVEWNDVPGYSDLVVGQNAVQTQLPGGLWIVESALPLSDVHTAGEWNKASVSLRHGDVGSAQHASFGMLVTN